jgi:hypothetical protein
MTMIKENITEWALIAKAKIKKFLLRVTGEIRHLKKGIKLKSVWYGNQCGGFLIPLRNQ